AAAAAAGHPPASPSRCVLFQQRPWEPQPGSAAASVQPDAVQLRKRSRQCEASSGLCQRRFRAC
ncbi:hypothetical protein ABB30_06860, partial [Stenotrophomonas ginsengisoli]